MCLHFPLIVVESWFSSLFEFGEIFVIVYMVTCVLDGTFLSLYKKFVSSHSEESLEIRFAKIVEVLAYSKYKGHKPTTLQNELLTAIFLRISRFNIVPYDI